MKTVFKEGTTENIGTYMKSPIITIQSNSTLREFLKQLNENKISSLIVSENNENVGIVTKRDFIRKAISQRMDPDTTEVSKIMNAPLLTLERSTPVEDAKKFMIDNKIRHVPVMVKNIMEVLGNQPEEMRAFIDAMHAKGLKATWMLARELPIGEARKMLDIGGGPGTYSLEWAKLHNHLHATVFDIPPVIAVAQDYIHRYRLEDRVNTQPGDFNKDDFGEGYDLILFANVIHMYGEDVGKNLIRKAQRALEPGGRIVIHGFCTDKEETAPVEDALFNLNMGMLTESGKAHPVKEKIKWMEEEGFAEIRHFRVQAVPTGVITGVKPE